MLRPYQIKTIELIRQQYNVGYLKVLLRMPTGAGKTVIFCEMLKQASQKGIRSLLAVRGRELVNQACNRLFAEGVNHGTHMSGHWNLNPSALVQVCSIDTLLARDKFPEANFIVIDEADQAASEGYVRFAAQYPSTHFLSVTATPYGTKSLTHVAQTFVSPISLKELTEQGYLVPFKYFAPSTPDLAGVRLQNGDYNNEQLESKMEPLVGDIISHWKRLGENRPTLLFAVNLNHSKFLKDAFLSQGIKVLHCDAMSDDDERTDAFNRLKSGEIKILCTVGIATRGVDLPFVSCLIMARPTRSYSLYIQMAGRGTRTSLGKSDCILLDHAGNVLRHGFITDEPDVFLDGRPIKKREIQAKICAMCFVVYTGVHCHACGHVPAPEKKMEIEIKDGILKELVGLPQAAEISIFVRRQKEIALRNKYKKGWVYYQVKNKWGDDIAERVCKKRMVPAWIKRKSRSHR